MPSGSPGAPFPFDAVLWDIDGTLADSEPVHQMSFVDACRRLRVDLPADFHGALLGRTDAETHAWLVETCGLAQSFSDWIAHRFDAYFAHLDRVVPHPLALDLWSRLDRHGIRQATVSNSDRLIVNANLDRLGLARPGLVSVSRNDVVQGKPDPEPYLRAAHLLGVDPARTAVVEDSATGLASARRAGMTAFMMPWYDRRDDAGWRPVADLARAAGAPA